MDPSSDGAKPEVWKESEAQQRSGDPKSSTQRSVTPLPPIIHSSSRTTTIQGRTAAIASFIQTPTAGSDFQSTARKKKRAGATSVQSPVPYEIMEDKENRISVSHIAATLPPDNSARSRNGGRADSAALSAFSRHADVPRLPPLPPAASAPQNGKTAPVVSGNHGADAVSVPHVPAINA